VKKNIIIILLILALCSSLFLLINNKSLQSVSVVVEQNHHNEYQSRDSPININTASREALESLPGIGPVLAGRIMQDRPFKDVMELNGVKGIGPKTIQGLEGKVVAK